MLMLYIVGNSIKGEKGDADKGEKGSAGPAGICKATSVRKYLENIYIFVKVKLVHPHS